MKRPKFTDSQIIEALKLVDDGSWPYPIFSVSWTLVQLPFISDALNTAVRIP